MSVEDIINLAVSGIKDEWSNLEKIRYIYLTIGKYLSKDTDFFFSAEKKLGDLNSNIDELERIYNSLEGENFKVICRSASYILQRALAKINIKSKIIKDITTFSDYQENGKEFRINHFFLAVEDDDKTYLMALASDLPYIQMGMKTRHFGSNIPQYLELRTGETVKIYEGEEIKHTILNDEDLIEMDKKIGYVNQYYNYDNEGNQSKKWNMNYNDTSYYMIKDALKNNKLYYEIEGQNTEFYKSLYSFRGSYDQAISFDNSKLGDLLQADWDKWVRILCQNINDKIEEITGIYTKTNFDVSNWNYEEWLKEVCICVQDYVLIEANNGKVAKFDEYYVDDNFKFNKWSRKIKKKFGMPKIGEDYDNVLAILGKMNALVDFSKGKGDKTHFNDLLNSLAFHFIDSRNVIMPHQKFITNHYIADKFSKVFPKLFSCNEIVTDFNKMKYSEQVVIIKDILELMYPELNYANSSQIDEYDDKYCATLNRVHIYPIKRRSDGQYAIVFNIIGDNMQGDYYFLYDLKKNTFEVANILQIYMDYIIVSERMKSRLEDAEDIELPRKK